MVRISGKRRVTWKCHKKDIIERKGVTSIYIKTFYQNLKFVLSFGHNALKLMLRINCIFILDSLHELLKRQEKKKKNVPYIIDIDYLSGFVLFF